MDWVGGKVSFISWLITKCFSTKPCSKRKEEKIHGFIGQWLL